MDFPDVPQSWAGLFSDDYPRAEFDHLRARVAASYKRQNVLPPKEQIFAALELVAPADVKVVILGQDPYPTRGRAHGLSFSVLEPNSPPPSLKNIFGELQRSISGWRRPSSGNLEPWARRGVLLLNSVFTVCEGEPMSHGNVGWERFTCAVLKHVQLQSSFLVFLLWGGKAQNIGASVIDASKHKILSWSHPSPMAQNRLPAAQRFIGNNHFVDADSALRKAGRGGIHWGLP